MNFFIDEMLLKIQLVFQNALVEEVKKTIDNEDEINDVKNNIKVFINAKTSKIMIVGYIISKSAIIDYGTYKKFPFEISTSLLKPDSCKITFMSMYSAHARRIGLDKILSRIMKKKLDSDSNHPFFS